MMRFAQSLSLALSPSPGVTLFADMRLGTTLHAQGSCYLELGATKVTAAVYGPREVARRSEFSTTGQLSCELKFAPFACRRRRGYIPDDQERELSQTLRTAVEPAVCLVSGLAAPFRTPASPRRWSDRGPLWRADPGRGDQVTWTNASNLLNMSSVIWVIWVPLELMH